MKTTTATTQSAGAKKPASPSVDCLEAVVDAHILPWEINVKWNENAPIILGEFPDRPPRKMSRQAIQNSFRVLKIANQGVEELDKTIKYFTRLETLILTANNLHKVDSRQLPRCLEFLELCANDLSSLRPLCRHPPSLTHLGVGYNHIGSLEGCVSASLWPRLLSLDLSHNDLDDLIDVVSQMTLLPSLRSLLLIGNPLSLPPSYRGFVIDVLRDLFILDDHFITSEERHDFDGFGHNPEIKNELNITLEAMTIRGLAAPVEPKHAEDQPEFPVVTRKFAVYFLLPLTPAEVIEAKARAARVEAMALAAEAVDNLPPPEVTVVEENLEFHSPAVPFTLEGHGSITGSVRYPAEDAAAVEPMPASTPPKPKKIPMPKMEEEIIPIPDGVGEYAVKPVKSVAVPWAEEMDVHWKQSLQRGDLLVFRNFLRDGVDVQIVEEKVLAYPADQIEGFESRGESAADGARSAASKGGGGGGAKSRNDAAKTKDAKATAGGSGGEARKKKKGKDENKNKGKGKDKGKDKGKGKGKGSGKDKGKGKGKKKGDAEVDLFSMPPEVTVVARFHANLRDFLDGERDLEFIFSRDGGNEIVTKVDKKDKEKEAKEDKDKEPKDAKGKHGAKTASKKDEETPAGGKKGGKEDKAPGSKGAADRSGGKSSATTKSSKGDKGGKGAAAGDGSPDEAAVTSAPPPLECHFRLGMARWAKASDWAPPVVEEKKAAPVKSAKGGRQKSAGGKSDA